MAEPKDTDYLHEAPDSSGRVPPPVVTAMQLLPCGSLGWDNFERLCLRLAERDGDVEYAGLYGVRGQDQQGIDVLVRLSDDAYRLLQCRRIEALTTQKIARAVEDFLQGKWADQASEFVLATSASATRAEFQDEIARQATRLGRRGISFAVWDQDRLSRTLKEHGDLVMDFFGRATRDAFLPEFAGEGFTASDRWKLTAEQLLEDLTATLEEPVSQQPVVNAAPLMDQGFAPDTTEQLLDTLLAPEVLASDLTRVFKDLRQVSSREAARLVAYTRDDPRRARSLIRTPQPWVEKGSAGLWNALGMLANAAGDWADAERALLRAEERAGADERALLLIRAGDVAEIDGRHEDAAAHYARARELDAELVAVRLVDIRQLHSPEERVNELAALRPRNERESTAVACARIDALVAAERLDDALTVADEILRREPDSMVALDRRSGITHMIATCTLADGRDPHRSALRRATTDSIQLRRDLRPRNRSAESGQLLARAAECLALASDFPGAIALVDQATEQELQHRVVRRALAQAAMYARAPDAALGLLGDEADWEDDDRLMAARVVALLDTTDIRRRAAELATPLLSDPDRREPAALAMLTAATWDTRLAWPEQAAEVLAETNPAVIAHFRAERLTLEGHPGEAEQLLQAHADDVRILRALVDRAIDGERWGRALTLADRLVSNSGRGEDRMRRAQAQRGLGQNEKVRQELASLAADPDQTADLRHRAFGALSGQLARADYGALEALTSDWVRALPDDRDAVWQRVFALARLARHPEALALLDEHSFEPANLNEARLAAEIYFRALRGHEATRRIAALSDRFDRSDEGLEGLMLFSSSRTQEPADADLGERIADAYRTFPERFPESKAIRMVKLPEDPEAIVKFFEEQLGRRDDSQRRTVENAVANGESPLTVLAALAGKHITELLPQLVGLPLAYGNPELEARELECARVALGGPAVWDPSSLAVVAGLPDTTRELIVARLPGSAVANSTIADCDTAESRIDDRDEQQLVGLGESGLRLTVLDRPQIERQRTAVIGSLELARALTPVPDSDPAEPDPLDNIVNADEGDATFNTWPATVSIARRRGLSVYSDDRFVRVGSLRENLEAFGTLALLTALSERDDLGDKEFAELRLLLLRSGALGLRATGSELALLAQEHSWEPIGHWLNSLADRLGWRHEPDTRLRESIRFLNAVWEQRPDLIDVWTARVLDCAQQALDWHTHEFFARVMLIYTWIGVAPGPWPERFAFGTALVRSIQAAPARLGIAAFEYPVEHAIELALRASPSPRAVRAELLRHIVRQLPFPKSAEVLMAFVGI